MTAPRAPIADPVDTLDEKVVRRLVRSLRSMLWFDDEARRWDPDKEWDSETVAALAETLSRAGLKPNRSATRPEDVRSLLSWLKFTDQGTERLGEVLALLDRLDDVEHPLSNMARSEFFERLKYLDEFGGTVSDTDLRRRFEVILGRDLYPISFTITWRQWDPKAEEYVHSMYGGLVWHGGPEEGGSVSLEPDMLWGIHS